MALSASLCRPAFIRGALLRRRPVPRRQGTGTPPGRCLLAGGFRVFCDFAKKIAENFIGQHFVDLACFVRNHGYNFWQRRRIFVLILAFLWDRRGAVLRWYSKNVFTTGTKCCIMFNNSVPAAAQAAPGGRAPEAGAAALCCPLFSGGRTFRRRNCALWHGRAGLQGVPHQEIYARTKNKGTHTAMVSPSPAQVWHAGRKPGGAFGRDRRYLQPAAGGNGQ